MSPLDASNRLPQDVAFDRAVQRCVDGELDDADERSLLLETESRPDGWRRLALAFVEDRLVRRICRAEVPPAAVLPSVAVSRDVARQDVHRRDFRTIRSGLALGLAVVCAFGVGRWSTGGAGEPLPTTSASTVKADADAVDSSRHDSTPASPIVDAGEGLHAGLDGPLMYVSVSIPENGETVDVPVYAAPPGDAVWQPFVRPAIAPEAVVELRRAGYRVESRQEILQFATPDGIPILLPTESVQVQLSRY